MMNKKMQMKALILAGGLGTRLRPVISDRPKAMADIGSKPFLEYQVTFLKGYGVTHFIFCVGYLYERIEEYFGDGSEWDVKIDYSVEEEPLGTGGALKHAERYVQDTFLALNGDSFLDADLEHLVGTHVQNKRSQRRLGTIALTRVAEPARYGTVRLGPRNEILEFGEKTAGRAERESRSEEYINAGIYVLEPEILRMIPHSRKVSIERDVFPSLLANGGGLYGCFLDGFFVDIGTPAGYRELQDYLKERTT